MSQDKQDVVSNSDRNDISNPEENARTNKQLPQQVTKVLLIEVMLFIGLLYGVGSVDRSVKHSIHGISQAITDQQEAPAEIRKDPSYISFCLAADRLLLQGLSDNLKRLRISLLALTGIAVIGFVLPCVCLKKNSKGFPPKKPNNPT